MSAVMEITITHGLSLPSLIEIRARDADRVIRRFRRLGRVSIGPSVMQSPDEEGSQRLENYNDLLAL